MNDGDNTLLHLAICHKGLSLSKSTSADSSTISKHHFFIVIEQFPQNYDIAHIQKGGRGTCISRGKYITYLGKLEVIESFNGHYISPIKRVLQGEYTEQPGFERRLPTFIYREFQRCSCHEYSTPMQGRAFNHEAALL